MISVPIPAKVVLVLITRKLPRLKAPHPMEDVPGIRKHRLAHVLVERPRRVHLIRRHVGTARTLAHLEGRDLVVGRALHDEPPYRVVALGKRDAPIAIKIGIGIQRHEAVLALDNKRTPLVMLPARSDQVVPGEPAHTKLRLPGLALIFPGLPVDIVVSYDAVITHIAAVERHSTR